MIKSYIILLIIVVNILMSYVIEVNGITYSSDESGEDIKDIIDLYSVGGSVSSSYSKKLVLSKSYYLKTRSIVSGTSDFKYAMPRDYIIANIDNDKYPDLIIWFPRKILIWSYGRGVYRTYTVSSPNLYISRPIVLDTNYDGIHDTILFVENDYLDAAIRTYNGLNNYISKVKIWNPVIDRRVTVVEYRSVSIRTDTYYLRDRKLFLPWVSNYYIKIGLYYKRYYAKIGLFIIDLTTYRYSSYRVRTYSSGLVYDPDPPNICDYTTNYEIYIVGYNDKIYLIPMGLDKLLVLKYNSGRPEFIREVNIGSTKWNDHEIVIARPYPAISSGGYTSYSYPLLGFWRSPQKLGLRMSYGYLIIPYGRFSYLNPTRSENGVYFRVEEVVGVVAVDIYRNYRVYKKQLLGRPIVLGRDIFNIVSITSIDFTSGLTLYFGGLAYSRYSDRWMIFIAKYYTLINTMSIVWRKVMSSSFNPRSFQVTVNIVGSRIYGVSSNTFYTGSVSLLFHTDRTSWFPPRYTYFPPTTLNPVAVDIDGDNVLEYCFVMYYNYNSGLVYYALGGVQLTGLYPSVKDGVSYIVWFDHPIIYIGLKGYDETNRKVQLNLYFESTSISFGYVEVYNEKGVRVVNYKFYGNKHNVWVLVFSKAGNYRVRLILYTRYRVNEWLWGGNYPLICSFYEIRSNAYIIRVRYYTRLTILYPKTSSLTPNLFINGLKLRFKLEYLDFTTRVWKPIEYKNLYVRVLVNQSDLVKYYGVTYYSDGVYGCRINGLDLGLVVINISFNPTKYYLPIKETLWFSLIKYPVVIKVSYPSVYPALTELRLDTSILYRYIDENGVWWSNGVSDGFLDYIVFNETSDSNILLRGNIVIDNSNTTIVIDKFMVLPGTYSFTIKYTPVSKYFSEAIVYGSYNVTPLILDAKLYSDLTNSALDNNSVVMLGSKIIVEIREYIDNETFRDPSILFNISFNGETNYTMVTDSNETVIDTYMLRVGNYTLYIRPVNYSYVYIPRYLVYNLSIVAPYIAFKVDAEPMVRVNYSGGLIVYNKSTYTLTPVKLVFDIETNYSRLLENATITIRIDGREYVLSNLSDYYIWVPVKPGYKKIVSILETRYVRLVNYTYLTVYPLPVNIVIERGSIKIETKDIFNRSAPGKLVVKIYDLHKRLVFYNEYLTNGTLVIEPYGLNGYYYVYIEYLGNESYLPSSRYYFLEIHRSYALTPLPEPRVGVIILILLFISIMLRRKKKVFGKCRVD